MLVYKKRCFPFSPHAPRLRNCLVLANHLVLMTVPLKHCALGSCQLSFLTVRLLVHKAPQLKVPNLGTLNLNLIEVQLE